jgi:conjugal transfer pilus assembly protein TraB
MENKITKSAGAISKKQKIVVISSALGVIVIFMLFMMAGGKKKPDDLSKIITNSKNRIILEDSSKGVKAEDLWRYQSQDTIQSMSHFMEDAEKNNTALDGRLSSIEKTNQELQNQKQIIESQSSELEEIKSKLKELQSNKNLAFAGQGANSGGNGVGQIDGRGLASELPREIGSLNLNLESSSKAHKKGIFSVSDYIPAGAYAKATIISGVDASVGISSQSDPRPVLIRVKGPAFSSIYDGNAQKADLSGCIVQGAASGDLSSEKIYVKLITMTCGKSEEELTEIQVKGYVAGQGKSGIRGNVISREGDLLVKSFLAGLVSGFGQGVSEKVAPPLAFSNGLTTQGTMSNEDVAKKGFGKGVSTASDRLANYLIDRAEQYQPVVSIPSGIDVEVVFVEGFYLNGKEEKAKK